MRGIGRICGLYVLLVSVSPITEAGPSQSAHYVIYRPVKADTLFIAFGNQSWVALHYELPDSIAPGRVLDLDAPLSVVARVGRLTEHPLTPDGGDARELAKSTEAYDSGDFQEASDRARALVLEDPTNPFYIEAYARAMFRIPAQRPLARDVYMGLVGLLDEQTDLRDSVIPIDVHFSEAYGKLGALHLDAQHYDSAAFELTRAVIAGLHRGGPELRAFLDMQLSYLTEAHAELEQTDVARWFGGATLRWNGANQYVLPYLRRLGPAKERIVSCTFPDESTPGEGPYTLAHRGDGGTEEPECLAPPDDADGTVGPCLRIGEVFVGVGEMNVHSSIGAPAQQAKMDDGGEAYMHLVFQDQARHEAAYYVVQYEDVDGERVVKSVQLTGQSPPVSVSFSCLQLGSPTESALRQLGEPSWIDTLDVETMDAQVEFWSYDPYPISLEFVQGRLYSVRVWRSDDLPATRRRPSLFYQR